MHCGYRSIVREENYNNITIRLKYSSEVSLKRLREPNNIIGNNFVRMY